MPPKKSYFHYKSLIKASRLLIFGIYIPFDILSNCVLKISVLKLISCVVYCFMNFLCISLFFQPFVFHCFVAEICCSHFFKHYLAKIN